MNFLDKDGIIKLVYRYFSPHRSDTATRAPLFTYRKKSLALSLLFIKHQQIIDKNSRNVHQLTKDNRNRQQTLIKGTSQRLTIDNRCTYVKIKLKEKLINKSRPFKNNKNSKINKV